MNDFPIFIVTADGSASVFDPDGLTSEQLFDALRVVLGNATLEVVRLLDGSILLVDEDGCPRGLPPNPKASKWAGQPIVGSVAYVPKVLVRKVLG